MIKLGTVKDSYKVEHLDEELQCRIKECLQLLDDNYGADRNIKHDLGGFIAVIENDNDVERLKDFYLDVNKDTYEYKDEYKTFTEKMYLLNDDYAVIVFSLK